MKMPNGYGSVINGGVCMNIGEIVRIYGMSNNVAK